MNRNFIKLFISIFSLILILTACNNKKLEKNYPKIIFDTDIGNDIDDVLALQMLTNYHNNDIIDMLCLTVSKSNPYSIEYADGFLRFNDIYNLPIGFIYEGPNTDDGKYIKQTLDTLIDGNPILFPEIKARNYVPEAWELQREVLSKQEDSSVVIIAVGPLTNLCRLLESNADYHSDLNGIDLVSKKVRLLSVMAGVYNDSLAFTEWNIAQDIESAKQVFEYWPTKIIASGWEIGYNLLYPYQSILNDFVNSYKHPLCVSYKLYNKMPYNRPTWDLTSVLVAVKNENDFFDMSPGGKISVDYDGKTSFTENENGKHYFLILDSTKKQKTLDALIKAVTWK